MRRSLVLAPREPPPAWFATLVLAGGVLAGLVLAAGLLASAGVPPGELGREFVIETLLDPLGLAAVLTQAGPLILVGVGAAMAFRVDFWNLGLEGQMIFGGIAATAIALAAPGGATLPLMIGAAMLAGIAWLGIAAWLRLRLGVSEIIGTLLLNYVAQYALLDLVYGVWKDPVDAFPHSPAFAAAARLPEIGSVSAGLMIAAVAAGLAWWLAGASRIGMYMRLVQANSGMALAVGVPVLAARLIAIAVSGALAGAGGFVLVAQEGRLTQAFFEGYGFSGVLIAFLARNNPAGALVVAVLVAALFVTGRSLQVFYAIPFAMVQLTEALLVVCVAASEFLLRYRLRVAVA